jgi:holo-[acyl-carrier protein] synthase
VTHGAGELSSGDTSALARGIRIGIDIADEREIAEMLRNEAALRMVFTEREIAECRSRGEDTAASLARRFAAKEALLKACREAVGAPAAIEILHDAQGAPSARWERLEGLGLRAEISLSSASPFAIAAAIVLPVTTPSET